MRPFNRINKTAARPISAPPMNALRGVKLVTRQFTAFACRDATRNSVRTRRLQAGILYGYSYRESVPVAPQFGVNPILIADRYHVEPIVLRLFVDRVARFTAEQPDEFRGRIAVANDQVPAARLP